MKVLITERQLRNLISKLNEETEYGFVNVEEFQNNNCTQSGFYSGKLFIVEKDASPTEYTQTIKSQTDLLPLMHSFCKNV